MLLLLIDNWYIKESLFLNIYIFNIYIWFYEWIIFFEFNFMNFMNGFVFDFESIENIVKKMI